MVRTGLAIVAIGLLALFGYFYVTSPAEQGGAERAKGAAAHVGDVVVDQGLAGLVRARLTTAFGLEAARYLHVRADDGHVLVYGLRPRASPLKRWLPARAASRASKRSMCRRWNGRSTCKPHRRLSRMPAAGVDVGQGAAGFSLRGAARAEARGSSVSSVRGTSEHKGRTLRRW